MLRAIILTLVLVHISLFIVRYFFVVCIRSSKSVVFKISLSAIFHRIDDFLIFPEGSNFRFSMPVSLVQWRGEIGIFYGKSQVFFNSSTCCSVVGPSYASICHNFCFTKLLTLILISFFSGILLSYHKKLMPMSSSLNHTLEVFYIFLLHGVCLNISGMILGLLYSVVT